jgi:hypothetical protein
LRSGRSDREHCPTIETQRQNSDSLSGNEARVFCGGVPLLGLQLPPSSLPVHLNAYFAVDRSEDGRFVHVDEGYRTQFCGQWAEEVNERVQRLESLKPKVAVASIDSSHPPPHPPADRAAMPLSSAHKSAEPTVLSSIGGLVDDWVPRKPKPEDGSSGSGSGGGPESHGAGDRAPEEHKDPLPAPTAHSLMLAQRRKITEVDPVASQRTLVRKWNIDLLSQGAVASYVDPLFHFTCCRSISPASPLSCIRWRRCS